MKILWQPITFLCFSVFLCANLMVPAPATASSLLFSPTRITLKNGDQATVLKVKNISDEKLHYRIKLKDYVMSEDGVTSPVEHFPYSAKRHIRFAPTKLTLEPGERQAIRIMLKPRLDLPHGSYHSHMFFEEIMPTDPDGTEYSASDDVQYVAALPVTIHFGEVESTVQITTAKHIQHPHKHQLDIELSRSGNGQGYAVIENTYIDESGNETALSADIKRRIYREINTLRTSFQFVPSENIVLSKDGHIRLRLYSQDWGKDRLILQEYLIPLD